MHYWSRPPSRHACRAGVIRTLQSGRSTQCTLFTPWGPLTTRRFDMARDHALICMWVRAQGSLLIPCFALLVKQDRCDVVDMYRCETPYGGNAHIYRMHCHQLNIVDSKGLRQAIPIRARSISSSSTAVYRENVPCASLHPLLHTSANPTLTLVYAQERKALRQGRILGLRPVAALRQATTTAVCRGALTPPASAAAACRVHVSTVPACTP